MTKDITPILAGWDHDPDDFQVRVVAGVDGRDKIQMRIDLGLIQMELDGRPDGRRIGDHASLLDSLEAAYRTASTSGAPFRLDTDTCAALMREGLQFYHRYLAAFHLQRYDLVVRDTERNLRLFAFVVRHAVRQRDKLQFDQYRPYVTMMYTRAQAAQALARSDYATALAEIDAGIERIRVFLREYDQAEQEAECFELSFLLRLRREVEDERPVGPLERLEQQLALAVARERYEEAARIRDQLQRLKNAGVRQGS
jgi:hypothetical protein